MKCVRIPILNARPYPVRLVVEPWGSECLVHPGSTVYVELKGPEGHGPELEEGSDIVIVYGWPGSTFAVYPEGADKVVIQSDLTPPAPPLGRSMRQFVHWMHNRPDPS